MLGSHVDKYMIHFDNCINYIKYFIGCEYYTFDTETCCTSQDVYRDYYVNKIKSNISGNHAKVYAWALSNTSNDYVIFGEDINQFIKLLDLIISTTLPSQGRITKKLYKEYKDFKLQIAVHNLKFDAEFLKYVLFDNNFKYYNSIVVGNKIVGKTFEEKAFNITENDGIVYAMNILFNKYKYYTKSKKTNETNNLSIIPQVEFFDTFKIMAQPLDSIGRNVIKIDEMFFKKADTYDYNKVRDNEHKLTQLEKEYLYCDVYILKEFMKQFYISLNLSGKTASSIAYKQFLKRTWEKNSNYAFSKVFPSIYENDCIVHNVKKSYKGGWTFVDRHYLGKDMKNINGTSIDINSSYPSQMYNKPLPYGRPTLFKGLKALRSNEIAIYTIEFEGFYNIHEEDYFGFLQANETNMREYGYHSTDYVYTNIIGGEPVGYSNDARHKRFRKYIWNFELENILKHTVLIDMEILETLVFKSAVGIFKDAIDYFTEMKINGKKEGNSAMTQFAKLCLNSFYGKMASNINMKERELIMVDGAVGFKDAGIEYESELKYYPPFASAVTSWGRCTLRDALYKLCVNKDGSFSPNVLYCDTDSIYSLLPIDEVKNRMGDMLDPYELGKWDIEKQYNRFKAIGSKKYMLTEIGKVKPMCKCAGLPKDAREIVTYETFYLGASFEGKMASKRVRGGVLIVPTKFELKLTAFNI